MTDMAWMTLDEKPCIGVSACLLGAKVRFNGGHKRDRYVDAVLREHFQLSPFCPEVAIGMGTPREPIRLVGARGEIRAVGTRDRSVDVTGPLRSYAGEVASGHPELSGFILKKGSPSCGMERVKVYTEQGMPNAAGTGLFADELMKRQPLLPVEEEGRLNDPLLRENFISRVYVYARWKQLRRAGLSKGRLVEFHARHKFIVMAHSPAGYRELGRLVGDLGAASLDVIADRYIHRLMELLKNRATRRRHVNVLQHLMGFLKKRLDSADRAELADTVAAYSRGEFPLVVPVKLLQHHFRRNPDPYVQKQLYLDPHPQTLMLRNSL